MERSWKHVCLSASVAFAVAALPGCTSNTEKKAATAASSKSSVSVAATFYPLAWMVEQVGGPVVAVKNLTPPGVEPHDLELTPNQVGTLTNAELAILIGGGFQPGPEKIAKRRSGVTIDALTSVNALTQLESTVRDPHLWLDPVAFNELRLVVVRELTTLRPAAATELKLRGAALGEELAKLDAEYRKGLARCKNNIVVTSHDAFLSMATRYGLRQVSLTGSSPDAEPDPATLADLATLIKRDGITTIFAEDLASGKAVAALARETGAMVKVLHPIEGLTKKQIDAKDDYLSLMRTNLRELRAALNCP
jgi:zinc transport system substrate-binding protein